MAQSKGTWVLWALGAFAAFKAFSSKTSSEVPTSAGDFNLLDTLSVGASDILATITGSKEPDFVEKMAPIAAQIKATYGIDPLITVSQAALESGWGLSGLTQKANNLFGFTGDTWAKEGKSVIYMHTHEYSPHLPDKIQYFNTPGDIVSKSPAADGVGSDLMVDRPFRAYPTWYDSVADWAALIRTPRYAAAYADAQQGDLTAFANDVAAAGYATEPDYASQMIAVGDDVSAIQSA